MTELARTASRQHLIDARHREADLIAAVVHHYIVETRRMSFAERIDTVLRKEFVLPYFDHLNGIEKAFMVAQVTMKISDVLWRIERERLDREAADA